MGARCLDRQDACVLGERAPLCRRACGPAAVSCRGWMPRKTEAVSRPAGNRCYIGQDRIAAERLARSMPHACRALGLDEANPPQTAASRGLVSSRGDAGRPSCSHSGGAAGKSAGSFASQHDQWVHALHSEDGVMNGDPGELARLAEQVRQWRRPIEVAASAPFRLCLRLEEPKPGALRKFDQWRVGYLLQAMDDQSLLVPVKAAWKARGHEAVVLDRDGFQPREYLLSALGQAATICPRIETSLKSATPAGYTVDSRGAHEFLAERAAALEQAGFGVFLPSWWSRKGTKLRLSARAVVSAATEDEEQVDACRSTRSSTSTGRFRSATRR